MEEIKLWKVGGSKEAPIITDVSSVSQTKTEEMLEEILVKSPDILVSGLKLVGRQTETPGGPLDLLGVDEDGQLIVFELKRGVLTRDAVAQIVDYASYLAEISPADLGSLISDNSGKNGVEKIDDFADWYQRQFGKVLNSIGRPKMVLVGLGVDDRARRMVEFLANGDIEMSLITFHGFIDGNETYLARQIEVAQKQQTLSAKASKSINLQKLVKKIKNCSVEAYFEKASNIIRSGLIGSYEWPNQSGYSYYLQDLTDAGTMSNRSYVSISIPDNSQGAVILTLQERAWIAAGDAWLKTAESWGARVLKKKGYLEVKISSSSDWASIEPEVSNLLHSILIGRKALQDKKLENEHQDSVAASTDDAAS